MLVAPPVKAYMQGSARHERQQKRQEIYRRRRVERVVFPPVQRHGFEIERAEDIEPLMAGIGGDFPALSLAYPAAHETHGVARMHSVQKHDLVVIAQAGFETLIMFDEGGLLRLICLGRNATGLVKGKIVALQP